MKACFDLRSRLEMHVSHAEIGEDHHILSLRTIEEDARGSSTNLTKSLRKTLENHSETLKNARTRGKQEHGKESWSNGVLI